MLPLFSIAFSLQILPGGHRQLPQTFGLQTLKRAEDVTLTFWSLIIAGETALVPKLRNYV